MGEEVGWAQVPSGKRASTYENPDYLEVAGAFAEPTRQAIEAADLLIVASPVYKGSYTGLFKHLFDFVGYEALIGKPTLLLATGGSERHALVIDHQLRTLFGFFRAATVPTESNTWISVVR